MPQSIINNVTFFQEYYLGDPPPFFSGLEDQQSSPSTIQVLGIPDFMGYPYSHNVPSSPPNPDRILTRINLETQGAIDSDGVQYGGNFRPNSDGIIVVGNLDPAQKIAVRNALTINEGNLYNNNVTDEYVVNALSLAGIGIKDFGYVIPYLERDIFVPNDTIEIPFFRLRNNGNPRETRISLSSVSSRQLTIDDGIDSFAENSMIVENVSLPEQRNFNILNVQVTADEFRINYSEDTTNRLIFKIDPRTSLLPSPISYTSSLDSNFPVNEFNMSFDIEFNATNGITRRIFSIRPQSRDVIRSADLTSSAIKPANYARIQIGRRMGARFTKLSGTSYRYNIECNGGTNPITMTFTNLSNIDITIEVNKSLGRIIIQGEDGLGNNVSNIFLFSQYPILFQLSSAINVWLSSINGWQTVRMNIPDVIYRNMFSEYLNNLPPQTFSFANLNLVSTLPFISLQDPNYTWTLNLAGKSLNYALDFNARYEEVFGNPMGLPVSDVDFGGMPNSWREFAGLSITTDTVSVVADFTSVNRDVNFVSVSVNSGTSNSYLYYYQDITNFPFSSFNTVQDLCNFFNTSIPHIIASPGLFYEQLDVSSVIPSSGTWRRLGHTIAEVADGPSTAASKIQIRGGQLNIGGTNSFPSIDFIDNFAINISNSSNNIGQLASIITNRYQGIINANSLNGNGSTSVSNLFVTSPISIVSPGDAAILQAGIIRQVISTYELNNFVTIESLVSSINQDWNSRDIVATVSTGTADRPDAIPANLRSFDIIKDMTISDVIFTGDVYTIEPPAAPESFIYLDYKLNWVNGSGPNIDTQGIQVALGGYKSNGKYFINQSPNAFFEPGFNSLFDVNFNVMEAEEVYILIRTRQNVDATSYTSNAEDYQGLVRFSSGYPSFVTNANILSGNQFNSWIDNEWNFGNIPASFAIPAQSNVMTLFADDISILDSLQVRINNFPSELDEFAFLALNRTNLNASMTKSRQGRSFGLVLDNRGIWDVLIGPEAEIQRVLDGEFDYLNFSFNHDPIDSDEAYNFNLLNTDDLDPSLLASIDLIPVPGFPKVAVLRIESGIKKYLSKLRSSAPANSVDGCSINIDILAQGRESGAQGIARVTIFADYTCVYDIGLCDFFWNITDPLQPAKQDKIENSIVISYQDYIDCKNLDINGNGDNARLSFPLLITFKGVPVFENGNTLLLIKGTYSASVEEYFFPSKSQFEAIQNPECGGLIDNAPLSDRLNQEIIFIEGEDDPITDPVLISQIINSSEPYLYINPRFQFPGIDNQFECGPNEIVIAAIGYQFQDWKPGVRQDDILIGINSIISNSTFSAPELEFCYKYYYRRES